MGQNKKSRAGKGRAGRAKSTPITPETADKIGMSLYMAIETLIARPSIDAYNAVTVNLMKFGRALGRREEIETVKQAMGDIYARYELVDIIAVNDLEAEALRAGAGAIDRLLPTVSLEKWALAEVTTVVQVNDAAYVPIKRHTAQEAA